MPSYNTENCTTFDEFHTAIQAAYLKGYVEEDGMTPEAAQDWMETTEVDDEMTNEAAAAFDLYLYEVEGIDPNQSEVDECGCSDWQCPCHGTKTRSLRSMGLSNRAW